ncbi:MAG: fumarylacetoacetate hydrolase family protein [Bacteroidales bacterium]|nr:fumarylacetoacetate hydrolase family protein [Candidatus Liminaster caballi]
MKIICVGTNYAVSNMEVNGSTIIPFLKPDTALIHNDWPFYIPDFSKQVDFETQLVVKISRLGKSIPARFAHRYYEEVTVGVDFTARDLQHELMDKGLPWEISKGFDSSAICGKFVKLDGRNIQDLRFEMDLNGETRQKAWTGDMIHSVDEIIEYVSRFYILKTGDLIFTGTPAGCGTLQEGDLITARLEGEQLLECKVR